jgi:hypothetical protein
MAARVVQLACLALAVRGAVIHAAAAAVDRLPLTVRCTGGRSGRSFRRFGPVFRPV